MRCGWLIKIRNLLTSAVLLLSTFSLHFPKSIFTFYLHLLSASPSIKIEFKIFEKKLERMSLAESSSLPLTTEIFQHVHSFLPPSSIATSTAVNREWRSTLLSTSTLHMEIDLSKLNGTFEMKRILGHFVRLANLSNHSLVRVNLNLSSFWPIWKAKMKINQEPMGYNSLVETLTKSRESERCGIHDR